MPIKTGKIKYIQFRSNKALKKISLIVTGALIFIGSLSLALFLLYHSKLSGAEFVAFVIAFAVIGLVIGVSSFFLSFSKGESI